MTSDTRAQILRVARELFVRQGYTATSMREISAGVGIAKATIYHHFPDKQALANALLEESRATMDAALLAMTSETEPRARMAVAAERSLRFLSESADLLNVVRREVPGGRNSIRTGVTGFLREYRTLIAEAVAEGTEAGIFRPIDPKEASRVFVTMVQGTFAMTFLTGEARPSPERGARLLLDIYFRGIDAR